MTDAGVFNNDNVGGIPFRFVSAIALMVCLLFTGMAYSQLQGPGGISNNVPI